MSFYKSTYMYGNTTNREAANESAGSGILKGASADGCEMANGREAGGNKIGAEGHPLHMGASDGAGGGGGDQMNLPWFKFCPQDFLTGTDILSERAVAAYIRLLCYQWCDVKLPDDDEALARLARTDSIVITELKLSCKIVRCDDGFMRNLRMEDDRKSLETELLKKAEGGKRGAETRKSAKKQSELEHSSSSVASKPQDSSSSVATSIDSDSDSDNKKEEAPTRQTSKKPKLCDHDWLGSIAVNPAYRGIDVVKEHSKAMLWCEANRRICTRGFFINWLNRAKPVTASDSQPSNQPPRNPGETTEQYVARLQVFFDKICQEQ